MVSRRAFLLGGLGGLGAVAAAGGAGYGLVESEVLPGKVRLDRALGRCGDLPAPPAASADVRTMTWHSAHRRAPVTATVVAPAAGRSLRGLPVAVALHGSAETGASLVRKLALDHYLPDAAAHGVPPFALAAVDGGPDSYWHPRASGDDPVAMIVDELLPRLDDAGARTGRVGLIGWSMGGFGALVVARRSARRGRRPWSPRPRPCSRPTRTRAPPTPARSTAPATSPATTSSARRASRRASRSASTAGRATRSPSGSASSATASIRRAR